MGGVAGSGDDVEVVQLLLSAVRGRLHGAVRDGRNEGVLDKFRYEFGLTLASADRDAGSSRGGRSRRP